MAHTYENYIGRAKSLLAEGFNTKQAQVDALDYCNRAFTIERDAIKQDHYDYRDNNNLSWCDKPGNAVWDAMRLRSDNIPFQLVHWRPKHAAENLPHNPLQVERINFAVALREEIKKQPVVKKPPQKTQKQLDEEARQRTCQICGRPIFAEMGVIAHHGYQRPGDGYQTASCIGARHLPFEANKDLLELHIGHEVITLKNMVRAGDQAAAEQIPVHLSYDVEHKEDGRTMYSHGRVVHDTIHFTVTRATFDEMKTAHPGYFTRMYVGRSSFDEVLKTDLARRDQMIRQQRDYLTWQKGRAAAWKLLERWVPALDKWSNIRVIPG